MTVALIKKSIIMPIATAIFLGCLLALASTAMAEIKMPKGITEYLGLEQQDTISGEILAKGSSRVGPIVNSVLQEFVKTYPKVRFQVEAGGSGTAIPALLDGTVIVPKWNGGSR